MAVIFVRKQIILERGLELISEALISEALISVRKQIILERGLELKYFVVGFGFGSVRKQIILERGLERTNFIFRLFMVLCQKADNPRKGIGTLIISRRLKPLNHMSESR